MLRSLRELRDYTIQATDGKVGQVEDFYFSDEDWLVHYLVASLDDRHTLVPHVALAQPSWDSGGKEGILPVGVKKAYVRGSPEADAESPEANQAIPTSPREGQLWSVKDVVDHDVDASDEEAIGKVEDWIVDDESWCLRYLIARIPSLLSDKRVLISVEWIDGLDDGDEKIVLQVAGKRIEESPEYDPSVPVNREQEEVLYDYYGRPRYWE